jgi:hypothetical protein
MMFTQPQINQIEDSLEEEVGDLLCMIELMMDKNMVLLIRIKCFECQCIEKRNKLEEVVEYF